MEKSPNVVNLPLFHLMDVILEILGDSRALTMDDVSLFEDFQSHPLLTAMAFKNIKSMCRRDLLLIFGLRRIQCWDRSLWVLDLASATKCKVYIS